jgi:hypothetical protein
MISTIPDNFQGPELYIYHHFETEYVGQRNTDYEFSILHILETLQIRLVNEV